MKEEYENATLIDVLRIVSKNKRLFIKMDTYEIVNPHDYIKKYIPSNYDKLSSEEKSKIKIPYYEDLSIYELPTYKEINHKEIMSKYVKKYISDKEIRQKLFYALRNYDYMDKFYNILRDYGLFNEYEMSTNDYYKEILKNWKEANNIKNNT